MLGGMGGHLRMGGTRGYLTEHARRDGWVVILGDGRDKGDMSQSMIGGMGGHLRMGGRRGICHSTR